ncbi:hypothetical protein [Atopobium sp. oral taxon 199]|uniref:hypothetical protein n=1 Tax=Atopobium sp. oral taxon 199 TaxID=712156 RepID=UPI00034E6698|nr:hypothetical protein [Atopobium sp. oral taxon 199]EPD78799.1 hypothetical protein HMPREF1527_01136 [Atopobium sp. oral taxon 199 str. F0494]
MATDQRKEFARRQRGALDADAAEELFTKVDETGHPNEERAAVERARRAGGAEAVDIDPLSGTDPSGSNVEKVITKTAVIFMLVFLAAVVLMQISCGFIRRANTANLTESVTVRTVASALRGGVEWGDGFTQFPEDFSVQEADENTGRVEVTVTDTSSGNVLECLSASSVQAQAFAFNCLLNPKINTVVYHVNTHRGDEGHLKKSELFGFLKPSGDATPIFTFTYSKTQSAAGVTITCVTTGADEDTQTQLRDQIATSYTPVRVLDNLVNGGNNSSGSGTGKSNSNSTGAEKSSGGGNKETTDGTANGSTSDSGASGSGSGASDGSGVGAKNSSNGSN